MFLSVSMNGGRQTATLLLFEVTAIICVSVSLPLCNYYFQFSLFFFRHPKSTICPTDRCVIGLFSFHIGE